MFLGSTTFSANKRHLSVSEFNVLEALTLTSFAGQWRGEELSWCRNNLMENVFRRASGLCCHLCKKQHRSFDNIRTGTEKDRRLEKTHRCSKVQWQHSRAPEMEHTTGKIEAEQSKMSFTVPFDNAAGK